MAKVNRDVSIDGLRGFAIFCMFYAHLLPHYVDKGTEIFLWERIISSVAAPLFLFLVGYNFKRTQNFVRVLKRSAVILFLAACIDVFVWNIFPFYSFDVLYLIGISLLILYLIRKFDQKKLLFLLLLIIVASFIFQFSGLYSLHLNEPSLNEHYQFPQILYNFFINGWFPLFPWIIFPIVGFICQSQTIEVASKKGISTGIFLLSIIALLFSEFNWRPFAVEIFYPSSWLYITFSIAYLFFIWSNKKIFTVNILSFFVDLGKSSLFLYVFHLSIYGCFGDSVINIVENRFFCFLLFLISFWMLAFLLNRYKYNWLIFQKSEILQILLGR